MGEHRKGFAVIVSEVRGENCHGFYEKICIERKGEAYMKKLLIVLMILGIVVASVPIQGAERGTAKEAEDLVKKAVTYLKVQGREKAFADFTNTAGGFTMKDLYIFVIDMKGITLAHGLNPKLVGKNMIELKDPDGKYFIKEFIEVASTKRNGWVDYKFSDPLTKHVGQKASYVERYEDLVVGCGIYRD